MTWSHETIRDLERASIRRFVEANRALLSGRVLDFGAGKPGTCRAPQPYRDLVSGEYVPFDLGDVLPEGRFQAILCTQVLQYVPRPFATIGNFYYWLRPGGCLLMTYPTSWDEVEAADLWRFTRAGMEKMLSDAGFAIARHERRGAVDLNGFQFPLGYGVVACRV